MVKIWTRTEFDWEEEKAASQIMGYPGWSYQTALEYVRDVRTGLEVDFLWDRETIGSC